MYTDNLRIFLEAKYPEQEASSTIDCVEGIDYGKELREGKSCKFDYKEIFATTNCTHEKHFGYNTNRVCVLLKLNKIVDFVPKSADNRVTILCEGAVIYCVLFWVWKSMHNFALLFYTLVNVARGCTLFKIYKYQSIYKNLQK